MSVVKVSTVLDLALNCDNREEAGFFFGANALESTQVKCRKIEFLAFKIEFLAFKIEFFPFQIKVLLL